MPHGLPARPRVSRSRVTRPHVAAIGFLAALALLAPPPAPAGAGEPVVLPNGLTLELVGVSTIPSRDRPWWAPDGSLLPRPPYEQSGFTGYKPEGQTGYELAVRVAGLPPGERFHRSVESKGHYVNGGSPP